MKFLITVTRMYSKEVDASSMEEAYEVADKWIPTDQDIIDEKVEIEE